MHYDVGQLQSTVGSSLDRMLDSALKYLPEPEDNRWMRLATSILWIQFISWTLTVTLVKWWRCIQVKGLKGALLTPYQIVKGAVIRLMLMLPSSKRKIEREMGQLRTQLRAKIVPEKYPNGVVLRSTKQLPEQGRDRAWLQEEWKSLKRLEKGDAAEGRVSGTVYHGGNELNTIISEAMSNFLLSNPLHSDVFPGTRKMESDIVGICLNLFNGPHGAGTTTSGGTESILMAVKTYRDWAKATKDITEPEMVIPASAHAAFWKAGHYFGVKVNSIPVNTKTRKANVGWMKQAINSNSIMIVGSAPNFPDGTIDPIPELAEIAKSYDIGLHVDCCLGSFIMPFLGKAGFGEGIEPFDFRLDGVTSISCDIHKYAFCPKGASVIMYNSEKLRRYQYFVMTDWTGGVYPSPTMAGSRPGMILAGAWAVMNHIGEDGYTSSCKQIVSAARTFKAAIQSRFSSDLYILGDPLVSVVAIASKTINIYALGDTMSKKGWHLNALSNPAALHMAFTLPTSANVDNLLNDLEDAIAHVKKSPAGDGDMVALYGIGQTSVGPYIVEDLAKMYIDVLYE